MIMTKKKKKNQKRGAVSATGKTALRFKKGSPQDTGVTPRKIRTKRLRNKRKTIPGHIGTRQSGESIKEFKARRDKYRKSLKK